MRGQEAGFDDEGGGRLAVDGRGRAGLKSPLASIFVFQISTASCVEHFVFLGRGKRGTDWNCVSTRASAKERAQWPKAMRRPWRTTKEGRRPTTRTHTIIARAAIVFFSVFFYEAVVQHVTYVTDFCRGCTRVVYTSWGTTPRNFQFLGTGVVAALQPVQ